MNLVITLVFTAAFLFDGTSGLYSKQCPHRQKYGHRDGICNERLIYVVHYNVCPLYGNVLSKIARTPSNPSDAAVNRANEYVFARLYRAQVLKQNHGVVKRSADNATSLEVPPELISITPASKVTGLPDPITKALIRKQMGLSFVRSGGGMWGSFINMRRWTEQNIVCECCYNVCTVPELTEYCPLPGSGAR